MTNAPLPPQPERLGTGRETSATKTATHHREHHVFVYRIPGFESYSRQADRCRVLRPPNLFIASQSPPVAQESRKTKPPCQHKANMVVSGLHKVFADESADSIVFMATHFQSVREIFDCLSKATDARYHQTYARKCQQHSTDFLQNVDSSPLNHFAVQSTRQFDTPCQPVWYNVNRLPFT
jgi:hypothetical protein